MSTIEQKGAKSDISILLSMDLSRPPLCVGSGRFVATENWRHSQRILDSWEVLVGLEGVSHLEEGGRRFALGPGDILFFRPGVLHRGYQDSPRGTSFFWAHFVPQVAAGESEEAPTVLTLPQWLPSLRADQAHVLMAQLVEEAPGPLASYLCGSLLWALHQRWKEGPSSGSAFGREPWLSDTLAWARLQVSRGLTVAELAERSRRHPDHLARVFRQSLGVSPLEWIHRERVSMSKRLMVESRLSLKEIARECGFHDPKRFSKVFQHFEAVTPSGWRKRFSMTQYNRG